MGKNSYKFPYSPVSCGVAVRQMTLVPNPWSLVPGPWARRPGPKGPGPSTEGAYKGPKKLWI